MWSCCWQHRFQWQCSVINLGRFVAGGWSSFAAIGQFCNFTNKKSLGRFFFQVSLWNHRRGSWAFGVSALSSPLSLGGPLLGLKQWTKQKKQLVVRSGELQLQPWAETAEPMKAGDRILYMSSNVLNLRPILWSIIIYHHLLSFIIIYHHHLPLFTIIYHQSPRWRRITSNRSVLCHQTVPGDHEAWAIGHRSSGIREMYCDRMNLGSVELSSWNVWTSLLLAQSLRCWCFVPPFLIRGLCLTLTFPLINVIHAKLLTVTLLAS